MRHVQDIQLVEIKVIQQGDRASVQDDWCPCQEAYVKMEPGGQAQGSQHIPWRVPALGLRAQKASCVPLRGARLSCAWTCLFPLVYVPKSLSPPS